MKGVFMKKYLAILALMLAFSASVFAQNLELSQEEQTSSEDNIFNNDDDITYDIVSKEDFEEKMLTHELNNDLVQIQVNTCDIDNHNNIFYFVGTVKTDSNSEYDYCAIVNGNNKRVCMFVFMENNPLAMSLLNNLGIKILWLESDSYEYESKKDKAINFVLENAHTISIPLSEEYTSEPEIYDYISLDEIEFQTCDATPVSFIVKIELGYKKDDKAALTEITQRTVKIIDFLRQYFSEKTAEELKPQNEEKLKIEIRDQINDDILSNSKIKEVLFTKKEERK
jgi:flagellar basal body-associated protein FliL